MSIAEEKYGLDSKFDVTKHSETFINYTEVVIHPDGLIEYAVPSHQQKLVDICGAKFNKNMHELMDMVPPEFYFDVNQWLCNMSNVVSVWNDFAMFPETGTTKEQEASLSLLKSHGCYTGITKPNSPGV